MSGDYRCQPNQIVDSYRLERAIGRGGFSEVWRARPTAGGDPVALKILLHPEHVAQLREEARALAVVRGPGIVQVLGVALGHEPPYLALGLVTGGDLRAKLQGSIWTASVLGPDDPAHNRLPPTEAISIFERLLEVLARVHTDGVVHADLKPENLLFDEKGRLLIGDFGLSRRISQRSASLSVSLSLDDARIAGTLDYMAPEQRAGEKATPRSDVYAAGVILYEMLTGERPQGRFQLPCRIDRRIPPVIDRVTACALAEDARNRFPDAKALLTYLRSGMAADWKELAAAYESVDSAVRWRREVFRFVAVLFSLGVLLAAMSVLALTDLGLRDASRDRALGGMVGFGAGLGIFFAAWRWWSTRRAAAFEQMRATIDEQIGHEAEPERQGRSRARPRPGTAPGCWLAALPLAFLILLVSGGVLIEWASASRRQKTVNKEFGHWVSHAGVISDERGQPLAQVTVVLDDRETTTTDDLGRFAFGRVSAGWHRIWARTDQLVSDKAWLVDPTIDFDHRVDYRMSLVPGGSIRGRVRVAERGVVTLLPGNTRVAVAADGSFEVRPLISGRYAVKVGNTLHLLRVLSGEVTVLDASGK